MKTKKNRSERKPPNATEYRGRRERTINIVGCTPLVCEQIRASLRRSPFHFLPSEAPLPCDRSDLYVVPAAAVEDLPARGVPVIAWGPAGLMRSAFLAGCDDFLRDPWTPEELALRAAAALSRARRRSVLPWGEVSWEGKDLRTPGGIVDLTIRQSRILRALLRARGEPVSRAALAYAMQGGPGPDRGRAIDVHVAAVRKKVRARVPEAGRLIIGVRGQGYMIP